jgi:hypothetical protein
MRIKFEIKEFTNKLITVCPYNINTKVGSFLCQECDYVKDFSLKERWVECSIKKM